MQRNLHTMKRFPIYFLYNTPAKGEMIIANPKKSFEMKYHPAIPEDMRKNRTNENAAFRNLLTQLA